MRESGLRLQAQVRREARNAAGFRRWFLFGSRTETGNCAGRSWRRIRARFSADVSVQSRVWSRSTRLPSTCSSRSTAASSISPILPRVHTIRNARTGFQVYLYTIRLAVEGHRLPEGCTVEIGTSIRIAPRTGEERVHHPGRRAGLRGGPGGRGGGAHPPPRRLSRMTGESAGRQRIHAPPSVSLGVRPTRSTDVTRCS